MSKLRSHHFRLSRKYSIIMLVVLLVSISVIFTDFLSSKVQNLDQINGFGQPTLILNNLRLVHVNLKTSPKISVIFRLSIFLSVNFISLYEHSGVEYLEVIMWHQVTSRDGPTYHVKGNLTTIITWLLWMTGGHWWWLVTWQATWHLEKWFLLEICSFRTSSKNQNNQSKFLFRF